MAIINIKDLEVIKNDKHPACALYHAPGERIGLKQLMAEGQAYAEENFPGQECVFAAHHDAIDGDHVHIVVSQ